MHHQYRIFGLSSYLQLGVLLVMSKLNDFIGETLQSVIRINALYFNLTLPIDKVNIVDL